MRELAGLRDYTLNSAIAMNSTGSVVAGESGFRPVIWRDGVVEALLNPNGTTPSFLVQAVDELGSVVVGAIDVIGGNDIAGVWTAERGAEPLWNYIARFGVSLPPDFVLSNCTAVSSDGQTFTGYGRSGPGVNDYRGFVVTVPLPGVGSLGLAIALFASRRKSRAIPVYNF